MKLADFEIGKNFTCGDRRYRCTDIGSRTVIAIRVDEVQVTTQADDGELSTKALPGEEAGRDGWFRGPPYPVAEVVFDEDDLEGCSDEPQL